MLNVKIQYYQNSIVKLYAHAGAGAVISHMMPKFGDSYNKVTPKILARAMIARANFGLRSSGQ